MGAGGGGRGGGGGAIFLLVSFFLRDGGALVQHGTTGGKEARSAGPEPDVAAPDWGSGGR